MVEKQKLEVTAIWIDTKGWHEFSNSKHGEWSGDALDGLENYVGDIDAEEVHVYLSPEFFLFLRTEYANTFSPLEQIQTELGLEKEEWVTTFTIVEPYVFYVSLLRPVAEKLDQLLVSTTKEIRVFSVPQKYPSNFPDCFKYPFSASVLYGASDEESQFKYWNLVPQDHPLVNTASSLSWEQFSEGCLGTPWTQFQGPKILKYEKIKKIRRICTKILFMIVPLVLLAWGVWSREKTRLESDIHIAKTYLLDHQDEVLEVEQLQFSQSEAWSKLKDLQNYSNQKRPIANFVGVLANETSQNIIWEAFKWKGNRFSLTIKAENMEDILVFFDRLKGISPTTTFEEIKSKFKSRKREIKVKFEGDLS